MTHQTTELIAELVGAQQNLIRAYVNLMEAGRDRIVFLGGECDPVDKMEASDPALREAKAALTKARAALAQTQGDVPHHWIVPHYGFLFPTEEAAQRYQDNLECVDKPIACYTHPQASETAPSQPALSSNPAVKHSESASLSSEPAQK